MGASVYILEKRKYAWGDYGDILVHGMSRHLDKDEGLLQLERAGPFVPPVTVPGIHNVVLTDAAKASLSRTVPGLQFRPVIKARIVHIDWHTWDTAAEDPPFYPEEGEPENYLLEREHDPAVASAIGDLWELVPDILPAIQKRGGLFNWDAYTGQAFVCADEFGGYPFISEVLKSAIEAVAAEWLVFKKVAMN